ncbi:hypothetical protein A4X13_0g8288 [Tilletia indica]|uniref:Uncharacterized protein n=1 Tax=Tilletia indica TaxID=43049 RepID=A0A177TJE3_9BASI|nr:hypothetical protein A4X13_0g8288 [Tilletia indica]
MPPGSEPPPLPHPVPVQLGSVPPVTPGATVPTTANSAFSVGAAPSVVLGLASPSPASASGTPVKRKKIARSKASAVVSPKELETTVREAKYARLRWPASKRPSKSSGSRMRCWLRSFRERRTRRLSAEPTRR